VSLTGNQLTIYLPSKLEWYLGPEGERHAREIGGNAVNFTGGLFPSEGQSIAYPDAKLLINHPKYGDLFKIAAQEFDVEPTGDAEPEETETAEPGEEQVMVNGQVMSKAEARELLGVGEGEGESAGESAPEDSIEEVPTESNGEQLTVLSGPTNKTDALEALGEHGVDLSGAPSAGATSDEIQAFAVEHGFVIEKYDLPE